MFGFGFYDVFIIAGILGIQYFLSTRNSIFWGAILPVTYIVYLSWRYITSESQSFIAFFLILAIGLLFLIEEWNRGRKSLRKRRKKELDKMILEDIN